MSESPDDPTRTILDAVSEALGGLEVVAHAPVQGEAMHKVVTGYVLWRLDEHGYQIMRKDAGGAA